LFLGNARPDLPLNGRPFFCFAIQWQAVWSRLRAGFSRLKRLPLSSLFPSLFPSPLPSIFPSLFPSLFPSIRFVALTTLVALSGCSGKQGSTGDSPAEKLPPGINILVQNNKSTSIDDQPITDLDIFFGKEGIQFHSRHGFQLSVELDHSYRLDKTDFSIKNGIAFATTSLLPDTTIVAAELKNRDFHPASHSSMRKSETRLLVNRIKRLQKERPEQEILLAVSLHEEKNLASFRQLVELNLMELRVTDELGLTWTVLDEETDSCYRRDFVFASKNLANRWNPERSTLLKLQHTKTGQTGSGRISQPNLADSTASKAIPSTSAPISSTSAPDFSTSAPISSTSAPDFSTSAPISLTSTLLPHSDSTQPHRAMRLNFSPTAR